jgi:uncharacterized damage-inducible protein DinB
MIEKIVHYTHWANKQIIDLLKSIPTKKFEEAFPSLFVNDTNCPSSSIRSLTEHILMGLLFSGKVMREKKFQPEETINSLREMTKEQLLEKWLEVSEEFVAAFTEAYGKAVRFKERKIIIDEDFVFAFTNHVVYHRAQINTALKMVEEKTNDADYGEYQKKNQ